MPRESYIVEADGSFLGHLPERSVKLPTKQLLSFHPKQMSAGALLEPEQALELARRWLGQLKVTANGAKKDVETLATELAIAKAKEFARTKKTPGDAPDGGD